MSAVAVVGMAGRFPGAESVESLWRAVRSGRELVRDLTVEELSSLGEELGIPESSWGGEGMVLRRGVLSDVDRFDAPFFGIAAREAELMDPQHRLFLEVSVEALDAAGHPDESSGRIGVFAGTSLSGYLLHHVYPWVASGGFESGWQMVLGNDKDHLATRVSYLLGLTGPSMLVQTACSTSLVAVHLARRSLLSGECDVALAGASAVRIPQALPQRWQEGGIVSRDGRCRAYDASAGGTVGGNGVGVVVLRRLSDALADGDTVHAVVRGSSVTNDGSSKVGYTAPSVSGQSRAIREALEEAGFEPESVGYVEGHGTGTALGDPIEVAALNRAFARAGRPVSLGRCALGSIKTNIGHLDTAAGIAGLIKAVLVVERGVIPPTVHFEEPSPRIAWSQGPFHVPTEPTEWREPSGPRRAGVSSFGLGGTNAHVVLEQAPEAARASSPPGRERALVLSARTATALERSAAHLAAHLREHPEQDLADVEHTLAVGRRAHPHRLVVFASDAGRAIDALEGREPASRRSAVVARGPAKPPAAGSWREAVEAWLDGHALPAPGDRGERRRVPLPPTSFDDHRFWVSPPRAGVAFHAGARRAPDAPGAWRREPGRPSPGAARVWLLVAPSDPAEAAALADDLQPLATAVEVHAAEAGGRALAASLAERSEHLARRAGDDQPAPGIVLFGPGWGPGAIDAEGLGAVLAAHAGPVWWLTRGREAVVEERPARPAGELTVLAGSGAGRCRTLDLPPGDGVPGPGTWSRVAHELAADRPLARGALRGRFRWTAAPEVGTAAPPPAVSRRDLSTPFREPGTELERTLAEIWSDLLGVSPIGVHDDFFELGGHSLLGTQAMARVSRALGVPVPLEMLVDAPALGELARRLEERVRAESEPARGAPRTAKEKRLARLFESLLGVEGVRIEDDFFALGGDADGLVRLVELIREMVGVEIPLERVRRAPTVAALARAVVELQPYTLTAADQIGTERPDGVLVALQPAGDRPPIFLVHPGGGHLLDYRQLARELAPDQPLFGLEAPGVVDDALAPPETIEEMAELYLHAVRRKHPRGPYHLAGYCLGGLVAFEMASRLRQGGEEVAWLGILDTVARPDREAADPLWLDGVATYYFAAELGLRVAPEELRARPPETWADHVWTLFLERMPDAAERFGEAAYRRLYRVFLAVRRASWRYTPRPYDGPLTLFTPRLAPHSDEAERSLLGWRDLTTQEVEHLRVPGSHTTMLKKPQVETLALHLRRSVGRGVDDHGNRRSRPMELRP
jgi:3-oxoacyl-(acyl-carrier-protein) synthase/thioesterase domain-containing protein/acyl carrier protein